MSLRQWRENGWLVDHQTTKKQITDLLEMVDRDLRVAEATGDADWSFGIAYNRALYLEEKRKALAAWADYIDRLVATTSTPRS